MKDEGILGLIVLGIIAWFFLKPKKALAEEVAEEIPITILPPTEEEIRTITKERPCYLTDYPCVLWYRTQYRVYV